MAALVVFPSIACAAYTYRWTGRAPGVNESQGWTESSDWAFGDVPSGSVGEIVFPTLAGCPGNPLLAPVCYAVVDNGGSVGVNELSIQDGNYDITAAGPSDQLTLGAGGLDVSASADTGSPVTVGVPLVLSAPQTWSVAPADTLDLIGGLTGPPSDPLSLALTDGRLNVQGMNEVGPVSVSGDGVDDPDFVELQGGDLNGTDGEPVDVSGTTLAAIGDGNTSGPLTFTGGDLGLAPDSEDNAAELDVDGSVSFDPASALDLAIPQPGTVAGTDYSQLVATGDIDLDDASLVIVPSGDPNGGPPTCDAVVDGQTLTLLSTTGGTLSGQFAGIPNGATVDFDYYYCDGVGLPATMTIDYTPTSVTATVNLSPVETVPPVLSGPATQGQPVSVTTGTWSNGPVSYTYQWQKCADDLCTSVPGATGVSYTPTGGDVGWILQVVVTATNTRTGLQGTASAVEPGPVEPASPAATAPPTISGTPAVGDTLTESHATWVFPVDDYTYQWFDCDSAGADCVAIASATGPTYTVSSTDLGSAIEVEEKASAGAVTASVTSAPTAVVGAPVDIDPPVISGTALEGQTLTATTGVWSGAPSSYLYVWFDCDFALDVCYANEDVFGDTYTLTAADVGYTIVVGELAANEYGYGAPAFSDPTALVEGTYALSGIPPITTPPPPPTPTTAATSTTPTSTTPTATTSPTTTTTASSSAPVRVVTLSAKVVKGALTEGLAALERVVKSASAHSRRLSFRFSAPGAGGLEVALYLKVGHRAERLAAALLSFSHAGTGVKSLELTARDDRLIGSQSRPVFMIAGSFVPIAGSAASLTKTVEAR